MFSVHSVRYWNRKWFSELFGPDWKGKTFDTGITVSQILLTFRLILFQFRHLELGNGSWILFQDQVFFQFRLENLVSFEVKTSKLSFQNICSWTWKTETFSSGNLESEKKLCFCELVLETNVLTERFFSFVDSALKMETKINILTECFFFSFVDLALKMETETNILTERFLSFVDSALKTETEMFAPRLENQNIQFVP
ncbi:hypothetical protein C1645_815558 [Glomus cerebriforme]|uniref:Uncharacterized protein n=1 Tax=Glomus cerebriforme TaxID=658196 RepID=A0A397TIT1_9GLOM|nr:hypothetical protein C1645_815558 [Glomus cerebriforme]